LLIVEQELWHHHGMLTFIYGPASTCPVLQGLQGCGCGSEATVQRAPSRPDGSIPSSG
jgi:hypothetical protein